MVIFYTGGNLKLWEDAALGMTVRRNIRAN